MPGQKSGMREAFAVLEGTRSGAKVFGAIRSKLIRTPAKMILPLKYRGLVVRVFVFCRCDGSGTCAPSFSAACREAKAWLYAHNLLEPGLAMGCEGGRKFLRHCLPFPCAARLARKPRGEVKPYTGVKGEDPWMDAAAILVLGSQVTDRDAADRFDFHVARAIGRCAGYSASSFEVQSSSSSAV